MEIMEVGAIVSAVNTELSSLVITCACVHVHECTFEINGLQFFFGIPACLAVCTKNGFFVCFQLFTSTQFVMITSNSSLLQKGILLYMCTCMCMRLYQI